MANISMRWAAVVVSLAACAPTDRADDTKGGAQVENQLVGTWKLVSAKYGGNERKFPEGIATLKHVTPIQFIWASYDEDGKLTRAAGGGYTLKGEVYEEIPEYGMGSDFGMVKGKTQTFKWKIEGNNWHHTGKLSNGLTIEEVWERVEK